MQVQTGATDVKEVRMQGARAVEGRGVLSCTLSPYAAKCNAADGLLSHPSRLLFEKIEEKRQNDADNDARGDGEVELKVVFLNGNVSRQSSQPWDLGCEEKHCPHTGYDQSDHDEQFSKTG